MGKPIQNREVVSIPGLGTVYDGPWLISFYYGAWKVDDLPTLRAAIEPRIDTQNTYIIINTILPETTLPNPVVARKLGETFAGTEHLNLESVFYIAGDGLFANTARTLVRVVYRFLSRESRFSFHATLEASLDAALAAHNRAVREKTPGFIATAPATMADLKQVYLRAAKEFGIVEQVKKYGGAV